MNNIVLYEPEIPQNTGNIMRTCVATNTKLHLIKPLGFVLDDTHLKRSGVNYIDKLEYEVYENYNDFKEKNPGIYYYFTRYGHKPHTSFDRCGYGRREGRPLPYDTFDNGMAEIPNNKRDKQDAGNGGRKSVSAILLRPHHPGSGGLRGTPAVHPRQSGSVVL